MGTVNKMDIMTIISIALGVFLIIGFFLGFLRSWKKSTIRFGLIVVCFFVALLLSSKISESLMSKYVSGLVISIFGQTIDFESLVGEVAGDLVSEGSALTNFATALLNIFVKLIAFLIVFISLMVVTLLIYYIIVAIMSSKQKKKAVGKITPKWWERLIGGGVGIIGSLLICIALFTPVFGVMNVCDRFFEEESKNATASAYAYENSLICGKFYTEDKNIGKVETYLEKYDKLRTDYKKSFAGFVFTYTGVDAIGKSTFNKLSTVTQNGMKVNFTTECVNIINAYNLYKTNFVENKFDLATEQSVEAVQSIYNIAKNSEVMREVVLDIVPRMASKWTNGETFLGMELPVSGDMKDIAVELLEVFNTSEFDVIDRNINVLLNAIRVANKHDIIADVNAGSELMDVIDRDDFVKDELNTLATTPEMKRALPNIMVTTVKLAYKSVIDTEPSEPLEQEFTQEDIAKITWNNESTRMQTIVTKMFEFFDTQDVINNLTNFGIVIDNARKSDVISKPVQILMYDYINLKVQGVDSAKSVLLSAIKNNWTSEDYSYTSLFATVETTAKVAQNLENKTLEDMTGSLENIKNNEELKQTVQNAVNSGIINDLISDEKKANVYKDMINSVLNSEEELNIENEMKAGQVVSNIVNKSSNKEGNESSMFAGETQEEKTQEAKDSITTLTQSNAVMDLLETESNSSDSAVKSYINGMNNEDKIAFENAIRDMSAGEDQNTLARLFGVDLNS